MNKAKNISKKENGLEFDLFFAHHVDELLVSI